MTKAVSMGQLTDELQEEGPKDGMGQVSKWGFVPGDDNTTDLDLERNGRVSSHYILKLLVKPFRIGLQGFMYDEN